MKHVILFLTCLLLSTSAFSQVGIGTVNPDASAALDLTSTTQGLLPPRMTADQRDAIASPAQGLMIYCTNCGTNGEAQFYNGAAWVNLVGGVAAAVPTPSITSLTGKVWMDRNLGANQVAAASNDAASYGDLYQWGRAADGHEKILRVTGDDLTSVTYNDVTSTNGVANFNSPGGAWDGLFIIRGSGEYNWVDPNVTDVDNLWQDVNGTNNPCPVGYRVPTGVEWDVERQLWINNNATGAFDSLLKLPVAGQRHQTTGYIINADSFGRYWSSTIDISGYPKSLHLSTTNQMSINFRALGFSVRCIKD